MDGAFRLDKSAIRRIHFVGIGGIGLSAIARVLQAAGFEISGSDAQQTPLTVELATLGMSVKHGHCPENVQGADLVVVSSAVSQDNPEVLAARQKGLPIVKRGQLLGEMMADKYGIAVAGTHGKTTTTAMIAFVLADLGKDPTFVVGGILQDLGTNARLGQGEHFVVEADEYDHTFLGLRPRLAVVTVIEMDHPDCFDDLAAVTADFRRFVCLVPENGTLVGCADQPLVMELLREVGRDKRVDVVTYGFEQGSEWSARNVSANGWGGSDFSVFHAGHKVGRARLRLAGLHNVSNALAVLAAASRLGLPMDGVLAALSRFRGVRRRFEIKGEARGVVVIDDYAHHPTEIRATLAAARRRYGARSLWVFFQPHTYSRTRALLNQFAASFKDADHVLVSDIYAAREKNDLSIHARDLVERIVGPDVRYASTLQEASDELSKALRTGDVLLTLGAGNGDWVGESVLSALRSCPERGDHGS
jgi:UDP-N-acetylmuramate--alanine ligase